MIYFIVFLTGLFSGLALMFLFICAVVRADKKKRRQNNTKKKYQKQQNNDTANDNIIYLSEYKKNAKFLKVQRGDKVNRGMTL